MSVVTAGWAFLKGLSPRTWAYIGIALAIAFAVWRGLSWYNDQIDAAEKRGAQAVEDRIATEVKKNTKVGNKISTDVRRLNDEQARAVNYRADALRVRGAGKATCTNVFTPSSSGPESSSRAGAVEVSGVPNEPRVELIGVRKDAAISNAEEADLNRTEVLNWRDWYQRLSTAWGQSSEK